MAILALACRPSPSRPVFRFGSSGENMPATGFPPVRVVVMAMGLLALAACATVSPRGAGPTEATAAAAAAPTPAKVVDVAAKAALPSAPLTGRTVRVGAGTAGMAFTADGSRAFVTDSEANTLSEVELATGRVLRVIGDSVPISKKGGCPHNTCRGVGAVGVALSADETSAFVTSMRIDSVSRIDLSSGRTVWSAKVQRYPKQLALTPDGRQVWVFNLVGNSISSVDAATGKAIGKPLLLQGGDAGGLPFGRPVGFALSPDGHRAYVGSDFARAMDVYDTRTRKLVGQAEPGSPWSVKVDADGKQVWAQFSDGLVVFDAETLEARKAFRFCRQLTSYRMALSPDGRHVALSLPQEQVALVASRDTGLLTHVFRTQDWPLELAFAPDGRRLVALDGGEEGGMSVFDLDTPMNLDSYLTEAGELFCRPEA
jgi:DNA-binding beta-propeller fold protein YncE